MDLARFMYFYCLVLILCLNTCFIVSAAATTYDWRFFGLFLLLPLEYCSDPDVVGWGPFT